MVKRTGEAWLEDCSPKSTEPMDPTQNDAREQGDLSVCPRCRKTETIAHNGGRWCPHCGAFAVPPDKSLTAHIPSTGSERDGAPLSLLRQQARQARAPKCPRCFQPVEPGFGIYDDGEWLCGACF